jgi:hypothetical protein
MRPEEGEGENLPAFLQPPKFGRVAFDPSLRTAAELVSMSISPVAEHVRAGKPDAQDRREFAEAS